MLYHINNTGEIKSCSAKKNTCPFGGFDKHFSSVISARRFFEDENSSNLIKTINKEKLSKQEAENLLKQTSFSDSELVGFLYTGSKMYNLNHSKSDQDIHLIAEFKGPGETLLINKNIDLTVFSHDAFLSRIYEVSPMDIDILKSKNIVIENKYESIFNNIRYNPYIYYERSVAKSYEDITNSFNSVKTKERSEKSLKIAIRSLILAEKMLNEGDKNFDPKFTEILKENFYSLYTEFLNSNLDKDALFRNIQEEARYIINKGY